MDKNKRMQELVRAIRLRRMELGYSQDYMATKMGIAQNTYSKIEVGKVKLTVEKLLHICSLLDVNAATLLDQPEAMAMAS